MIMVSFQNLTEFNTAHNRRIASVAELVDVPNPLKRKPKTTHVTFADEEEVINPGNLLMLAFDDFLSGNYVRIHVSYLISLEMLDVIVH